MESSPNALYEAAMTHSQPIAARIPAEILTLIIEWLQPGEDYLYTPWDEYPWPYTYVCRYWRQVLVAAPHLWTCINIGNGHRNTRKRHIFEPFRLALQLQRTGILPLFLSASSEVEFDSKVLQLIATNHSRWKEANLDFFTGDVERLLLSHESQWTFDELRQLEFKLDEGRDISPPKPDLFMHAPKLEILHLTLINLHMLSFPWSQLTRLSLTYVYAEMAEIQQVFSQCTSILDLELVPLYIQGGTAPPNGSIALPSLETLSYETSPEDGQLLSFLHMPALEELTFTAGAPPLHEIQSYLLSARPPLTALRFTMDFWLDGQGDVAIMADILEMVPSLEHFAMGFPPRNRRTPEDMEELVMILTLLNYSRTHRLCPNLMSLTLRQVPFSNRTTELFMKMLASRSVAAIKVMVEKNGAILKRAQESYKLIRPEEDSQENRLALEDANAAMQEVEEYHMDKRGLKAGLHELRMTLQGKQSKEDCFSEAQLSRIKELTDGMISVRM